MDIKFLKENQKKCEEIAEEKTFMLDKNKITSIEDIAEILISMQYIYKYNSPLVKFCKEVEITYPIKYKGEENVNGYPVIRDK